jgi:hypothetical protein
VLLWRDLNPKIRESWMSTQTTVSGPDSYTIAARIWPGLLAAAPALALGLAALPLLPGIGKLWTLLAAAFTTFAALAARRAGNRIQPVLWKAWGGPPTVERLRYSSQTSAAEVSRRHREVERILGDGLKLPTPEEESNDPVAADAAYFAATRRVIALIRGNPDNALMASENRNYGFARNLIGLKPFGLWCSGIVLVVSVAVGIAIGQASSWNSALPLLASTLVSIVAMVLWLQVDADFVKPSADAYADRLIDALDNLPPASS